MSGGFPLSLINIYNAGIKVVEDIVFNDWDAVHTKGIPANNYVGDIFGSLGGVPDFGYVSFPVSSPCHDANTND